MRKKILYLFFLILSLSLVLLSLASCDDDSPKNVKYETVTIDNDSYFLFNGHYYKYFENALEFENAEYECEKIGGHLVTITSEQEDAFICSIIDQRIWLGGTDKEEEGTFVWITGEEMPYTDWAANEPNNDNNEDYMEMYYMEGNYGKWNDVYKLPLNYVCEWDTKEDIGKEKYIYTKSIKDADDLKAIAGTDAFCIVENDIDLEGAVWTPIEFSGTLDGDGYTISGFVLNDNSDNLGFFSTLNGNISNTNFSDVFINAKSTKSNFGIIAGTNNGNIVNCSVYGTVVSSGAKNVGGLVGNNASAGVIENCTNYASVTAGDYVGGIAGISAGKLLSCFNEGAINGGSYVGGICGDVSGTAETVENNADISATGNRVGGVFGNATGKSKNRKNSGNVISNGDYVGGLVGYSNAGSSGNDNTGAVTGKYYVGGFYGYTENDITGHINNSTVTGKAYIGGIAGKTTGVLKDCENHGEIISTGTIIEDNVSRSYLGGLAGYSGGAVNCKNDVDITGVGTRVGGLSGYLTGDITDSQNDGTITGMNGVGGLGGDVGGAISNSTNNGQVIGDLYVGGLAGYMYGSRVDYCINNGIIRGGDCTGGLIGYVYNAIEVSESENKVDVNGNFWTGGYIGYLRTSGTIRGAVNNDSVTGKAVVGGIVGYGYKTDLFNCENYGIVVSTGALIEENVAYSYIGGLAGRCSAIKNCKNAVSIIGIGERVGGLAGYADGTITESENDGDIIGKNQTGGLIGYLSGNIAESKNHGAVSGENYTGGLVGYFSGSRIDNSLNDGGVTGGDYTGGLAGCSYNDIEVTSSSNNVNVSGENYTGGYIGYARAVAKIRNAVNKNAVVGKAYVGGIVGKGGDLYYCENHGPVTSTAAIIENDKAYSYAGGLAGSCSSVNNGKNTFDVVGVGRRVGGLAGYVQALSESVNSGNVIGKDYAGGLAGYINGGNVTECVNNGSVTGENFVGGVSGYFYAHKIISFVNTGKINGSNYVGSFVGYSYFTLEIIESENSGNITASGERVGSLIGEVRTDTNIRSTKNSGKVNDGYKAFIGYYAGTIKGLPYITETTLETANATDVFTVELLNIEAYDWISKNPLNINLEIVSGNQEPGATVILSAAITDEYANTDIRYYEIIISD